MFPPASRLHEDDGLREGERITLVIVSSLATFFVLFGLYHLAAWVWSWSPRVWAGLGKIAFLAGALWLFELALVGLGRSIERWQGLEARRAAAAEPRPVLPLRGEAFRSRRTKPVRVA